MESPSRSATAPALLLVVPHTTGDSAQHPGGQLTAAAGLLNYLTDRGTRLHVLDTAASSFPPPPLRAKIAASFRRVRAAWRLMQSDKIAGSIEFSGGGLSLLERVAIAMLCRRRGIPSVLFFRNSEILDVRPRSARGTLLAMLLRLPDRIAVQGELWRAQLVRLGIPPDRIVVVPNWMPPSLQLASAPKSVGPGEPVRFVFVGWLIEGKGVRELLDAVALIGEPSRMSLTIVGGGTLEPELRRRARQLPSGLVELTGWTDEAGVARALERANVFVLPTYREGFPNALLEAMARGLPAITTPVGAIPESISDGVNGFLVPPRDAARLAERMRAYVETPGLVERHSAAALETVRARHMREPNCELLVSLLQIG